MKMVKAIVIASMMLAVASIMNAQEIFDAIRNGDIAKVKELVEKDPQLLHSKDKNGRTPLHWAARGVHFEVLKYLLEKGADANALDNNHITPIMSVTTRTHLEALKLLLNKGAKIEMSDNEGNCPIHFAAYDGFKEAVQIFLERGSSIDETEELEIKEK